MYIEQNKTTKKKNEGTKSVKEKKKLIENKVKFTPTADSRHKHQFF